VRQYLVELAAARGWTSQIDAVGNLVVRIPATAGCESAPGVVMQGHLDMVCEKNRDVDHDFATQGIDAYVDGDQVRARGTSLGADNGIGLALGLAISDEAEIAHGPFEILATIEEETGLTGASALDGDMVHGRILLNLDSEDEGEFYVGCAGGGDQAGHFRPERSAPPADSEAAEVCVEGLLGGHSGLDIALGRGNAILVLARTLAKLGEQGLLAGVDTLAGGSKHNAIPREARAVVRVPAGRRADLESAVAALCEAEAKALGKADPGLTMRLEAADGQDQTIAPAILAPLLDTLLDLPHGVVVMSADIDDLVQTSNNVAILSDENGVVRFYCSSRSSVAAELEALRDRICARMEQAGAKIERDEAYPGWQPNLDSPILDRCKAVYTSLFDKDPPIKAVHAGLECGIIGERVPGMDMISFGPDIRHPHSPDEYVDAPSVARTWQFLQALVQAIAKG